MTNEMAIVKTNKFLNVYKNKVVFISSLTNSSFTSRDALQYVHEHIFEFAKFDKIVLSVGCNDYFYDWKEIIKNPHKKHDSLIPIEEFTKNIQRIIELLIISGIKPILVSFAPINHYDYFASLTSHYDGKTLYNAIGTIASLNEMAYMYNQVIKNMSYRFHLNYIDLYEKLNKTSMRYLVSEDNMHLNKRIEEVIIKLM